MGKERLVKLPERKIRLTGRFPSGGNYLTVMKAMLLIINTEASVIGLQLKNSESDRRQSNSAK